MATSEQRLKVDTADGEVLDLIGLTVECPRELETDALYRIRLAQALDEAEEKKKTKDKLPDRHAIVNKLVEDMTFEELHQYAPAVGVRVYGNETTEAFRERLRIARNNLHRSMFGLEWPMKPPFLSAFTVDEANGDAAEKTVTMDNGSKRSHLPGRRDLIPKAALDALAGRLEYGAKKYGENNWRHGGELMRQSCINHLINHIFDYIENGNVEDNNTAAIITNAAFLCHFEELKPLKGVSAENGKI